MHKLTGVILAASLALAACDPKTEAPAPDNSAETTSSAVSAAQIMAAENTGWLSHGRTYDEQRFSPLSTVNTGNVSELGLAWSFDLDSSRGSGSHPDRA